ncbi:MAG: restriction endonuclease subunit S [Candidatus Helarchaeota archaeon]
MKEIKICKMKLSDFATVIMGQSPSSNFYNEEGKGLPFFQGVTDFSYKYPNETFWTTVAPKKAEINDVLFSVRAPVGDVNIANKKCCIGRGIAAVRSKTNQIDYLYYLLKYQSIKIQRLGTGAVYDAIKKSDLENILLDVFEDPNSQFQVGSLLVLYDDLIDTNRRRGFYSASGLCISASRDMKK